MNKNILIIYILVLSFLLSFNNVFAQFGGMKLPSAKDVKKKVEKEVNDSGEAEEDQSESSRGSGDGRKSS